jgi:hypothetical protein
MRGVPLFIVYLAWTIKLIRSSNTQNVPQLSISGRVQAAGPKLCQRQLQVAGSQRFT